MSVRTNVAVGALAAALLVGAGPATAATTGAAGPEPVAGTLSVQEQEAATDDVAAALAAAAVDAELGAGETLAPGEGLLSPSGRYGTVLTEDGQLLLALAPNRFNPEPVVLFVLADGDPGAELRLQGDGNLVMYDPDGSVAENFGTAGSGATRLVMQDDRNLVLYGASGRVVLSFDTLTLPLLGPGQALLSGDRLRSEDGSTLVMQADGNLVLYQAGRVRFQSRTASAANAGADAVLQEDGNFVVYAGDRAVFSTGTRATPITFLVLGAGQFTVSQYQDDPFTAVYGSAWGSSTVAPGQTLLPGDRRRSADGRSVLRFQADGNLVQYRDGRPVFQTGTAGKAAFQAVMQADGNFVLYGEVAPNGSYGPLYQTRTAGSPGASLVVPDGGRVFVRSAAGGVVSPR